jgi:hypothetical protein
MTTRVRLTYEDYAVLPDDGRRYELHEGRRAPLTHGAYREAGTLSGTSVVSLSPSPELMHDPREIWPTP